MVKFNNGKESRSLSNRTSILVNSFKILEKLDLDHTQYLVNSYLGGQEYDSI